MKDNRVFIKNILEIDIDSINQTNRYIVRSVYDVVDNEGFADIEQKVIEDLTMTWQDIKEEGGIAEVNRELQRCYNL